MEKADIERLVEYYTKKLTDFEAKYGIPWTKNKYASPPTEPGQYYDFSMKMHAAYVYRQTNNIADFEKIIELHAKAQVKEVKKTVTKFESFNVSPKLFASLSGFNGGKGQKLNTPEEFFEVWLSKKTNKKGKIHPIGVEGQNKKEEVVKVIAVFLEARAKKKGKILQAEPPKAASPLFTPQTLPIVKPVKKYQLVQCERCGAWCEAFYTLSLLTKGLWVHCKNCGNHARPYAAGLNIAWKPSKTFIKAVGNDEAVRLAAEMEEKGEVTSRPDLRIGGR